MNRVTLPNRRMHETFRFEHWGQRHIAGVGRASPQDPIREVWLNVGKSGEHVQTLARDSAILLSLALQYNVPLSDIQHALTRNADGTPAGPIGALIDEMVKPE